MSNITVSVDHDESEDGFTPIAGINGFQFFPQQSAKRWVVARVNSNTIEITEEWKPKDE